VQKNELKPHENEIHETARFEQSGIEKVNREPNTGNTVLHQKLANF